MTGVLIMATGDDGERDRLVDPSDVLDDLRGWDDNCAKPLDQRSRFGCTRDIPVDIFCDFFGGYVRDVPPSVSRVNPEMTQIAGIAEAQEPDAILIVRCDQVFDCPPFESAPLFLAVLGAEKNEHVIRLGAVQIGEIRVEVWLGQFEVVVVVIENRILTQLQLEFVRNLLDPVPVLTRERECHAETSRFGSGSAHQPDPR